MTDVGMSRRGALGALAAFTAAPAIALPAPVDAANALWAERQKHVVRLLQLSHEYNAAHDKLPAWAMSGPERLDANGNFCGNNVAWPLVEDLTPPSMGERIVRPSIYQAKENFEICGQGVRFGFDARVSGAMPSEHASQHQGHRCTAPGSQTALCGIGT